MSEIDITTLPIIRTERYTVANNRVYFVCDKCGEKIFLAKYFPSQGWYNEKEEFSKYFEDFLEKHSHYRTPFGLDDGNVPFTLEFEIDD